MLLYTQKEVLNRIYVKTYKKPTKREECFKMNRTDSPLPSQIKRARRSKKESSVQRAVQKLIGTAKMRLYELSDTVKPLLTDEKKRYAVYGAYIVAASFTA